MSKVRGTALALLVVTAWACGDDGDDVDTQPDASSDGSVATGDAGPDASSDGGVNVDDGGAPDGGNIDGGGGGNLDAGDAHVEIDARAPDAGAADAGDPALEAALNREGINGDGQRATLVLAAFCRKGASCGFPNPGATEATCLTDVTSEWTETLSGGSSLACLDAVLDWWSCYTVQPCTMQVCDTEDNAYDALCSADAGT